MTNPLEIPETLDRSNPLLAETISATEETDSVWYDGRQWWRSRHGAFFLRVAPRNLDFVLRSLVGLIDASQRRGLAVAAVGQSRHHHAGVGIGSSGNLAAIEIIELRGLGSASPEDVDRWRYLNDPTYWDENGKPDPALAIPRGNDKLRVILPRRPDWPHRLGPGWRRSFTALAGEPFLRVLAECLEALDARAKAGRS